MEPVEMAKQAAAHKAVDVHVNDGNVIGIGSGSTIVYAVQRLRQRVQQENIQVKCVPTSFQARQLITENGLTLTSLEEEPELDVTIDGADEADQQLTLIKGGGGCLAQEKVVAEAAKLFVMIADHRKKVDHLGTAWKYIPIEVLPLAYKPLQLKIQARFGGTLELRMSGKSKAGPVVTDNSNFIIDWFFDFGQIRERIKKLDFKMGHFLASGTKINKSIYIVFSDKGFHFNRKFTRDEEPDDVVWKQANAELLGMAGVVDTGLFIHTARFAYFGMSDGSVQSKEVQH